MKIRLWFAVVLGVALLTDAAIAAAQSGTNVISTDSQGMVRVRSSQLDEVFVQPGASFRGYTRVMIDPPQVALAENWLRDINRQRIAILRKATPQDAAQIVDQARAGLSDSLTNAFRRAGYEIVTAPGADVLRMSPRVVNMYVNAPAPVTTAPLTHVYTVDAGEATLVLDVRDSTTDALIGRVLDRRTAGARGTSRSSLRLTSPASNQFDFGGVFDDWSRSWLETLQELKVQSPVASSASVPLH